MKQSSRSLPANLSFVVQFMDQPAGQPPHCEGRVEHLASGQATRFASQDALWTFISHILTALQEDPDAR